MIKISLVVLVGLAATVLLRKRSAAVRHWILAASILCAAATPLLEMIVPAWPVPLSPALFGRSNEPLPLFIPIHELQAEGDAGISAQRSAPVPATTALRWLVPIWLAGAGISLSFLLAGFARLGWLASRSRTVVNGTWASLAATLATDFGLRRPVRLLQSDHPTLLVTWGLRQPTVILPHEAANWPADRVRIVLGHELAHIRRGDWLVQMSAELLRSVYWFNPLLWIACRRLRRESEHACDDEVLAMGIDGPAYASHLLDLARAFTQHRHSFFPAPAMARPSSLERRVRAMLNTGLNRSPISRSASLVIVIALLTIAVPIAGIVASAQSASAAFSGSLVDAVGRILPDVPLVLTDVASRQKHEARSDQSGLFSFTGLPAGEYLVETQKLGFATAQGRVRLGAGQTLIQDVALQIGSLEEHVTISDGPPNPAKVGNLRLSPSHPTDVDRCAQTTVGGCIQQPYKMIDVKPRYPDPLHGSGASETVLLEARIGVDGFINDLRVVAPAKAEFADAAVEAVRQWTFSQTRLDGVPVEVRMRVTVVFTGWQ
jgi:TonB family protein